MRDSGSSLFSCRGAVALRGYWLRFAPDVVRRQLAGPLGEKGQLSVAVGDILITFAGEKRRRIGRLQGEHRNDRAFDGELGEPGARGSPSERWRWSEASGRALIDKELAGTEDLQAVNLRADDVLKIGFVEREEDIGFGTEGGEEDGAILGLGEDQYLVEGEFDRHEDQVRKQGSTPVRAGFVAKLGCIAVGFLDAIGRGKELPAEDAGMLENLARRALGRAGGGKQDAGVEEEFHFFNLTLGVRVKAAISASSRAIQRASFSRAMSRTGTAAAGCRKSPPSRSSTMTRGLLMRSRPSLRRSAGGRVRPPRLLTGRVSVMRQCCIAGSKHGDYEARWSWSFSNHVSSLRSSTRGSIR